MNLRNIAIIAHVDHGKTTLVDQLLKQSGAFRVNETVAERVMDSNDIERERGITILAKCTSLEYNETRINIVDTPGHADFGGEVERILSMVNGVVLLVDSAEGPLPQTKFVLSKALALGLKPIVVINKIDRSDARPEQVLNEIFDLFVNLGANDEQLDFPTLYAVGRDGWCTNDLKKKTTNLNQLYELIISYVKPPKVDKDAPFAMLATLLESNVYLGRMLTGKIYSGKAKMGMPIKAITLSGEVVEQGKLTKIQAFRGIKRIPIEEAEAGDIISIAGLNTASVADTICDISITKALQSTPIDPPTMAITIGINTSPLSGTEGDKVTSRMIRDRLFAEQETNVAIKVRETDTKDTFEVGGRGELQLGVLVETMRREGFELSVGRPKVLYQYKDNKKLEPIEEVVIDLDEQYSGIVIDKLSQRKGEMQEMKPSGVGKIRLVFLVPSRGLIGYQSEFMTDTKGTGVLNRIFHSYKEYKGDIGHLRKGVLISTDQGNTVPYALFNLQDRGRMFVGPRVKVYEGMIVGENSRENDIAINVLKCKKMTNIRAAGCDENVILTPPVIMSLEQMMTYINEDELVEVTPKNLRLRKKILSANERKIAGRNQEIEE
jgi:GTP-binding protein